MERGQAVGKVSVYQGENLLSEYEVRAAVDAAKLTLPDALYLLWESLTVCPDQNEHRTAQKRFVHATKALSA